MLTEERRNPVYSHNGMLYSNENEYIVATWTNKGESSNIIFTGENK